MKFRNNIQSCFLDIISFFVSCNIDYSRHNSRNYIWTRISEATVELHPMSPRKDIEEAMKAFLKCQGKVAKVLFYLCTCFRT
jgi:hypothetical protein